MADAREPTIEVEIVYALPQEQCVETLQVPVGTTVGNAIEQSGILQRHPEIAAGPLMLGIFGRRAEAASVLSEFDRIEIYRPLTADPRQSRRTRARRAPKSPR